MSTRAVVTLLISVALLAAATPALADRPDTPDSDQLPPLFEATEEVESFDSAGGQFRIHYTRSGPNAVPATDGDGSGVPDYVESVAATYDAVLAFYQGELGFLPPVSDDLVSGDNGGDARFDVYLVDFVNTGSDGSFRAEACLVGEPGRCTGYMVQENDFVGYPYPTVTAGVRILASHEFFHAVQAAYRVGAGSVLGEATATWASEKFDATLGDLETQVYGYLDRPERSLDQEGTTAVDAFSYGAALFFQFLDERFGTAVIRELWEAVAADDSQTWAPLLDAVLTSRYDSSFALAFAEFARWNLYTGSLADEARSYQRGAAYPSVATTAVTAPYSDDLVRLFRASARYFSLPPAGRAQVTAALVAETGDPAELAGARLLLVTRSGNTLSDPLEATDATAGVTVEAAGVDEVIAVMINPAVAGDSLHPGFCFGSPEEVAACQAKLGTTPVTDGGPGPDTALPTDGGGGGIDSGPGPGTPDAGLVIDAGTPPTGGGGCSTLAPDGAGASPAAGSAVLLGLLLGLTLLPRRLQRWSGQLTPGTAGSPPPAGGRPKTH